MDFMDTLHSELTNPKPAAQKELAPPPVKKEKKPKTKKYDGS